MTTTPQDTAVALTLSLADLAAVAQTMREQVAKPDERIVALDYLHKLRRHLERVERGAVAVARDSGASWDEIGWHLRMSRQAAWERYHE